MKGCVTVRVDVVEKEVEMLCSVSDYADVLFRNTMMSVGITDCTYFALTYQNCTGQRCWFSHDDPTANKQKLKNLQLYRDELRFGVDVRCYPFSVKEVSDERALGLIFRCVRRNILQGHTSVPPQTAVFLAAATAQLLLGDYREENRAELCALIGGGQLFSHAFMQQWPHTPLMWLDLMLPWYLEARGWDQPTALINYLLRVETLDQYGVQFFEAYNRKMTMLFLGVEGSGINVYAASDKCRPRTGFPWSEIDGLEISEKQFIVKPCKKGEKSFSARLPSHFLAQQLLDVCISNHKFFLQWFEEREKQDKSASLISRLEELGIDSAAAREELGVTPGRTHAEELAGMAEGRDSTWNDYQDPIGSAHMINAAGSPLAASSSNGGAEHHRSFCGEDSAIDDNNNPSRLETISATSAWSQSHNGRSSVSIAQQTDDLERGGCCGSGLLKYENICPICQAHVYGCRRQSHDACPDAQLTMLRLQLSQSRSDFCSPMPTQEPLEDSKALTLQKIRRGNTQARIEEFEAI